MNQPIDVVITWVDGDDPRHAAKRSTYQSGKIDTTLEDVGGATRFASQGEIEFCVGSIIRFAPFVRKIFIITDNQDPRLDQFVERNFPDSKIPIEIVDHTTIFRGYEEHLPTFNSLAIETLMWRIPDLSDHYIYFNDDVMLLAPSTPEDWFDGNNTVCYARKMWSWCARLMKWAKPKKNGHKTFGHKDAMLNAADISGTDHFGYFPHIPLAQDRILVEQFYKEHPEAIIHNIRHKFRDPSQFNTQIIGYLAAEKAERIIYRSPKNISTFLKPTAERQGYMERKLRAADNNPHLKYGCISSFDKASDSEKNLFREWIANRLKITLTQ